MRIKKVVAQLCFIIFTLSLLGCAKSEIDKALDELITLHRLDGNPIQKPKEQVVDIDSPRAQLGKLLFFTKNLSGQQDVACASCHHPFVGGDDDLSLSIGVNPVDPNRVGKDRLNIENNVLVPRNAPTTFNSSLYNWRLFHDGRVERLNALSEHLAKISTPDEHFGDVDPKATSLLQAQAGFPVTSEHEMRNDYLERSSNEKLRLNLVKNIIEAEPKDKKDQSWEMLFREVYDEADTEIEKLITVKRVRRLLADYQSSQIFIDSPWKDYIEGNSGALSASAKKGALLFYTNYDEGGAGCVNCHSGDFFTDERFHVLAVPHIGFGVEVDGNDRGRFLRSGVLDDRFAFRTPSLLNVEHTGPYGHNGAYDSLREIIKHHLNPEKAIETYDFSLEGLQQKNIASENAKLFTGQALEALKEKQKAGHSKLREIEFAEVEIDYLVAFMKALSDDCLGSKNCLSKWVPKKSDPNPDGLILFVE